MGIGIGYISDVLSGGTTLAQMESGLVIGYSAGMIRRALLNLRGFSNLVILFVFSLFHSALIFGLLNLTSGSEIARFPWRAFIIPKGVLDAFLGSVFFWLLMKWSKFRDLFEEKEELGRLFYSASGKS